MITGNQAISFSVKSQLAKLLATENISMRHEPSARTAYFNVDTRLLVLPVWQNISEDLYDMLVVHEVGHALDTPMDKWVKAITTVAEKNFTASTDKHKAIVKGYLNVIEDARIDKRQKRRYPGSRRNYVNGYRELHERDFFNIAKRDVNKMSFIDRVNIFFKHGAALNIKFSEIERKFLVRIENAETFEDVVEITSDVLAYSIKQKENEQQELPTDVDFDDISGDYAEGDGHGEIEIEIEIDEDSDEDSDGGCDLDGMFEGDADEDEDDEDGSANSQKKGEQDEASDQNSTPKTASNGAGASGNDKELDEPETEAAAERSMASIVMNDNYRYYYGKTPELNLSAIVDYYPKVMAEMEASVNSLMNDYGREVYQKACESFLKFRREEQDAISFLVKEFEMRKAADTYAKTAIAKTGVINTNTLHSYKYNDDIFKRQKLVPTGKNHGFIMFLDWSGSMLSDLRNTMRQLFSIVLFCKKVQVPFEVYLFKTGPYDSSGGWQPNRRTDTVIVDGFRVRNILSSKMNMSTLNRAFTYLWLASSYRGLRCDTLDGTPLNQTIMVADELVNKFRRENKLQIVNTVFLTDGGSDATHVNYSVIPTSNVTRVHGNKYFLEDHKTKKNYYVGEYFGNHKTTEVLLKMLKDRTECNLIGFFITRSLNTACSVVGILDEATRLSLRAKWNADSFIQFNAAGYDSYFAVNMHKQVQTHELKVNSDMTQKAVLKEFMKFSEKKLTNRAMLTEFIKLVVA